MTTDRQDLATQRMPTVMTLVQTCIAIPSQWEGELDDGRSLYVRYRHGLLRVGVGEGLGQAIENSASQSALHCERLGDEYDGAMSFKELRGHLRGVLDFHDELVVGLDPDWGSALAL